MRKTEVFIALVALTACFSAAVGLKEENITASVPAGINRDSKVFSLFSVVQFKNTGCRSQSAMSSGQSTVRNGTCYTASECSSKGGSASGNCASGFGVCCLFLVSTSGATISQNCTYLRNPSFPSVYSATSSLSYSISKCSTDVCYIRLDFETFQTLGPATTTEPTGCVDTLVITTSTTPTATAATATINPLIYPSICGNEVGQHIYIDIGNTATDTATLAFSFTGTSTVRTWEIKVSQITCSNLNRPPTGCLQYYTTLVGRIMSFNFKSTTSSHLWYTDQNICIRQAQGYCCVQYQVCADQTSAFSIDRVQTYIAASAAGLVDTSCTTDYLAIPASSFSNCNTQAASQYNRYCGYYLGLTFGIPINQPICDCTAPFTLNIHSDGATDGAQTAIYTNRGVCLDYQQVPCTQ
jgi:hypothetical protein